MKENIYFGSGKYADHELLEMMDKEALKLKEQIIGDAKVYIQGEAKDPSLKFEFIPKKT